MRSYPVWVTEPRIVRVGRIELPAAIVDAYPQVLLAIVPRPGFAADAKPESVLLIRAHVRKHDGRERGLVVAPGKNLELLTRCDEFTLELDLLTLEAIQASVN
jgi:hypothetical protein